MKYILASAYFICLFLPVSAQKVHVWCPPEQQTDTLLQGTLLNREEINLIIYDARTIADTEAVKCTSAAVRDALVSSLQSAFPGTRFNLLDSSEYRKEPFVSVTTLKIGIAAYHSGPGDEVTRAAGLSKEGFSVGDFRNTQWVSLTGCRVSLISPGARQKTFTKDILNIVTRPAIGGLLSARKALASSYQDVLQELVKFVGHQ